MSLLLVGERINATGSRLAQRLLLNHDRDGLLALAREQLHDGAHALDVCVAMPGRTDEAARMSEVIGLLAARLSTPLFVDSADVHVIAGALPLLGDRGVANSVTLKHGRRDVDVIAPLVGRHRAAVVALCIDERGLALDRAVKLEVAERLYDLIVREHRVPPASLYVDVLTRPPQERDARDRDARAALAANEETFAALRLIKERLPGVRTLLGISDASYGLPAAVRAGVNRQVLRRAVDAGLDAAIIDVRHVAGNVGLGFSPDGDRL